MRSRQAAILEKILKQSGRSSPARSLAEMGITENRILQIYIWTNSVATYGALASYIPELAMVDPGKRSISIGDVRGKIISVGNGQDIRPSIQSVVKPFLYMYALERGASPKDISGIEATAAPFNIDPILKPTLHKTIPGHPLNNAGALSSAGCIEDFEKFLTFMKQLTGNAKLSVLENIYTSEMETNMSNRILVRRLVSIKRFSSPAAGARALQNYTRACAIGITTAEVVRASIVIANRGRRNTKKFIKEDHAVRAINAMNSYGLYEHTGEISLLAAGTRALSSKSGVGGLMVNIDPGRGASCTYSPLLDEAGNSVFGKYALIPLNVILGAPDATRLSAEEIIRCIEDDRKKHSAR